MSVLEDLVARRLIEDGDEVYFVFRQHRFAANVGRGGILYNCTWKASSANGATPQHEKPIFRNRGGFQTLTSWCDACLHECLDEYISRFSAFKRVRHTRTECTMDALRSRLRVLGVREDANAADSVRQLRMELELERRRSASLLELLQDRNLIFSHVADGSKHVSRNSRFAAV